MIAADTSSMVAYLSGQPGTDIEVLDRALELHLAVLPPVVIAEILSDPALSGEAATFVRSLPRLEIHDGYWERAGLLRRRVLGRKLKARLGDALVAQSCLDHKTSLITRDRDFRHFAREVGLRLES
jgi:predicted nucleic acid-binding protein